MDYFFQLLTFSLCVSLGLKQGSCRQHMYRSCFCIPSASLCFLVGAFNQFSFKIIIDTYIIVIIFLFICGFFKSFCFSSSFVVYSCVLYLNFCSFFFFFKADLMVLSSLNFYLSVKLWISPLNLNQILAGVILVVNFFVFHPFKYIMPLPSGLQSFC